MYRQTDRVAMGSPLGLILANIFIGNLERQKFKHVIDGTTFYCRYIDDTFFVCNNHKYFMNLINQFNKTHKDIAFTTKHEVEGISLFLDNGIRWISDDTLQRYIHCKNMWSGIHLNYYRLKWMLQVKFDGFEWENSLLKKKF